MRWHVLCLLVTCSPIALESAFKSALVPGGRTNALVLMTPFMNGLFEVHFNVLSKHCQAPNLKLGFLLFAWGNVLVFDFDSESSLLE